MSQKTEKYPNVMLDLETLSTRSNAVILSIGAVKFDLKKVETVDEIKADPNRTFYANVHIGSQISAGLHIDPDTIAWWQKQSDEARHAVFRGADFMLPMALMDFTNWLGSDDGDFLWGNGANFDNVILESAYQANGSMFPFKYNAHRCYRTIKELYRLRFPESFEALRKEKIEGLVSHHALDDAIYQTIKLQQIMDHLGKALSSRVDIVMTGGGGGGSNLYPGEGT